MEKILVLTSESRLALVERIEPKQVAIFNPQLMTDALARAAEFYSPDKVKALAISQKIKHISDSEQLAVAKEAQGRLAAIRIDAEKDRKFFTQPFLDSQRFIKEQYDLLSVGITKEEKRLDAIVQTYAQEVERKRQEQINEQRRKDEEAAKVARERQAEIDRLAKLAAEKPSEEAAEKLEEAQFAAELAELETPAPIEIAAPVGKAVLDFELAHAGTRHETADILAFAKLYPHMCKIEIRRSAVTDELNNGACFGAEPETIPVVPGLRIFEKFRTTTRAVR